MALDILRRTGGWCVELTVPIRGTGGVTVDQIEIKSPTIGHMTRWQRGDIPSSLALLAELCGIPEQLLSTLSYPDADRVLLALFNVAPQAIKGDFTNGARPLATPDELLPEPVAGTRPLADDDPRYPRHDGPVQPVAAAPTPPPTAPLATTDPGGDLKFDIAGPPVVRRVVG